MGEMSDSDDDVAERQFKICLIGDPGSGKSSLASRYANDSFTKNTTETVGVEFYLKRTELQGRHITLKVWDVGGGALKSQMLDKYAYGADAILMVYDVTNEQSFTALGEWLRAATGSAATATTSQPPAVALVANKIDMEHARVIKSDRQHKFAQEN